MRISERRSVRLGLIGLLVALLVGAGIAFADDIPFLAGGTRYTGLFAEAAGLRTGDPVEVAGVNVGRVESVALDRNQVRVAFRVHDTWVGDRSTASIRIRTTLGAKHLALDPLGNADQDPDQDFPRERTVTPLDVTAAFNQLSDTVGQIDTAKLAQSFQTLSDTFSGTAGNVRGTLTGLSALSKAISDRDTQLSSLLGNAKQVAQTLAQDAETIQKLIDDGGRLLSELQARRDAIAALLKGTRELSEQLSGLVSDNKAQLGPTLAALDEVTDVLQANRDKLTEALKLAGPYYRLVGNTLGSGRWLDTYLCGLIPDEKNSGSCLPARPGGK
ncbi:MCE family protein [Pseudonocardiaceae bacterium YIM PH 21723]|nr:MCE family protein [Pseudonocardiaceae bacterium YIM PH 21723]